MKSIWKILKYPAFFLGSFLVLSMVSFLRMMIETGSGIEGYCAFYDTRFECAIANLWSSTSSLILFVSGAFFATFVFAVRNYGIAKGYIDTNKDKR